MKKKNVIINPIHLSQPAGAALAFSGIKGSIPLWHGVQGCSAFSKVLFIQHFREPMPFENTALTQTSVVMGAHDNATEALAHIHERASFFGLLTTGVSETSGVDLDQIKSWFEERYPGTWLVPVNTPDFEGCLQTGFEKAVKNTLKYLVQPPRRTQSTQISVLMGPYFTPGEVREMRDMIEDFELHPIILPDLGDSLYGYLTKEDYSPCTIGGTLPDEIMRMSESLAVITLGQSMHRTGRDFAKKYGSQHLHFNHLSSLENIDQFYRELCALSQREVHPSVRKDREHLQDTLLDTHFYFYEKSVGLAGEPEFIFRWKEPLESLGIACLTVSNEDSKQVVYGDLATLHGLLQESSVNILVGNSHLVDLAKDVGLPLLRTGLPVYDRLGEPQKVRIGYRGTAAMLRELANTFIEGETPNQPYLSKFRNSLMERNHVDQISSL